MSRKRIEVKAGERFGRLVVLGEAPQKNGHRRFYCKCDCGNMTTPILANLRKGQSKSCGCLRNHGHCEERIYICWAAMKRRCLTKTNPYYKNYGGRGITVCEEWMEFMPFYEWAMNNGYRENLTIERNNNDKGYFPNNCTWIPLPKQHQNKRTCIPVASGGIKFPTIAAAARHFGIPCTTAWYRVKRGVDVHQPPKVKTNAKL